jgi:methionyl-tRNA formyltransferase
MKIAIINKYQFYSDAILAEIRGAGMDVTVRTSDNLQLFDQDESFEYVFFPHYSKLVPSEFLSRFVCIGFHIGNLPFDKGGSPIQNKIIRGEYETFVNAFMLSEKLDEGDLISSLPINLEFGSVAEILDRTALIISKLVVSILKSERLVAQPQPHEPIRFRRLNPEDSRLPGDGLDLKALYDRIRMLDGLDYPQAFIEYGNFKIEFGKARLNENSIQTECVITHVSQK